MTTKKELAQTTDIVVPQEVTEALVEMIAARVVEKLKPIILSAKDSKEGGCGCEQASSGS